MAKKAASDAPRCHVCGDTFVKDARSGTYRHRSRADCPFQPGEDLDADVCCRILAAFGHPAKDCPRLLEAGTDNTRGDPDATNLQKLSDLILETEWGLAVDWRGEALDEDYGFVPWLVRIAAGCGVGIEMELDDDDLDAVVLKVRVGKRTRRVEGITGPAEVSLPSLAELAAGVAKASGGRVVTRVVRIYEPSDTWGYVALCQERWRAVEKAAGDAFAKVFIV